MSEWVVNLTDVKIDKSHPFTLIFTGFLCSVSNERLYTFTFTGADLYLEASVTEQCRKKFKEALEEDYGYGPYKLEKAKRQLKKKYQYRIEIDW